MLYCSWPMTFSLTLFRAHDMMFIPRSKDERKVLVKGTVKAMLELHRQYKDVCVLDGSRLILRSLKRKYASESSGHMLHPLMNPSERRSALVTWPLLDEDVLSGKWPETAQALSSLLEEWKSGVREASLDELRTTLQKQGCSLFTGKRRHYMSIRFCRALLEVWELGRPTVMTIGSAFPP